MITVRQYILVMSRFLSNVQTTEIPVIHQDDDEPEMMSDEEE
jgi:hypothetical protein